MNKLIKRQGQIRKIGNYEYDVRKVLGVGQNSSVYQGYHIKTKKKVCLKQIKIPACNLDQILIKNQIEALSSIKSKNVINYIQHFSDGKFIYLITQLCQQNLGQYIKRYKTFNQAKALSIFSQILKGYKAIRQKGFIHRDLKQENILILNGEIKIADFGYATKLQNQVVKEAYNVGSPLYMSPQALQMNLYSEKSDIWSLGIILYSLLSGKDSFSNCKNENDVFLKVMRSIKVIQWTNQIKNVIISCLCIDLSKRMNLHSLIQAIESQLKGVKNQNLQIAQLRSQKEKQINIIQIQLKHIKFLQYLIKIGHKLIQTNIVSKIIFLCQFEIRMLIDSISKGQKSTSIEHEKLWLQINNLKILYTSKLQIPKQIQFDHLSRAQVIQRNTKQSTLWMVQADLKKCLKQYEKDIKPCQNQEDVCLLETEVKFLDFGMTAFILNRYLIQSQSKLQKFTQKSYLDVILNSPTLINLDIYRQIINKFRELHLNDP